MRDNGTPITVIICLKTASKLNSELSEYLNKVKTDYQGKKIKALIGPHAGLYYSGPTAAWAYKHLTKDLGIERVFLFGPSHHKYFPGCTLTYVDEYNTPMGPIPVDVESTYPLI